MRCVWSPGKLSSNLKMKLFKSIAIPTAMYGCEAWKDSVAISKKINVFQQRCLRRLLQTTYKDRVTNEDVLKRTQQQKLSHSFQRRGFQIAGHVVRMDENIFANGALAWKPVGKRGQG